MTVLAAAAAAAVLLGAASAVAAEPPPVAAARPSACKIGLIGEVPVEFRNNRPLIKGAINGQPVRILLDTGASATMLFAASAARLKLPLEEYGKMAGVGGMTTSYKAILPSFEVAGVPLKNFVVLVAGEGSRADIDMLLGDEFFRLLDVEFDLKHGAMRLIRTAGCSNEEMAYWAKGAYSQTPLTSERGHGKTTLDVKLNGKVVHALLDSGASTSVATPEVAARVGVKLSQTEGRAGGIGARTVEVQTGVLDTFAVGDETIRSTRLRFAPIHQGAQANFTGSRIAERMQNLPEMLLGADFLASHRVLISRDHKVIYFTYEGGPVFDATRAPEREAPAEAAGPAAAATKPG